MAKKTTDEKPAEVKAGRVSTRRRWCVHNGGRISFSHLSAHFYSFGVVEESKSATPNKLVADEAMSKRAARFGLPISADKQPNGAESAATPAAPAVTDPKMKSRSERFGTTPADADVVVGSY